jgi:hypothetical protein
VELLSRAKEEMRVAFVEFIKVFNSHLFQRGGFVTVAA